MPRKQIEERRPEIKPLLCATAGCPYDAKVRSKSGKIWLNLCIKCDDERIHKINKEWCLERGLDTSLKQQTYCKTLAKTGRLKLPIFNREPGEDETYVQA